MVESKPHPWFDQELKLNLTPCDSCGVSCDLLEKPAPTGEYVPGGDFEIKSRTDNVVLKHEDICESCLVLAKTAIILRPSLYKQGFSDPKPLLADFTSVKVLKGVINATVFWVLFDCLELLTRQAITISHPEDVGCIFSPSPQEHLLTPISGFGLHLRRSSERSQIRSQIPLEH